MGWTVVRREIGVPAKNPLRTKIETSAEAKSSQPWWTDARRGLCYQRVSRDSDRNAIKEDS
jgi:hypothetical protein